MRGRWRDIIQSPIAFILNQFPAVLTLPAAEHRKVASYTYPERYDFLNPKAPQDVETKGSIEHSGWDNPTIKEYRNKVHQ